MTILRITRLLPANADRVGNALTRSEARVRGSAVSSRELLDWVVHMPGSANSPSTQPMDQERCPLFDPLGLVL